MAKAPPPKVSKSPLAQKRPDGGVLMTGGPRHDIDDVTAAMIEKLRSAGMSRDQIAKIVQLSPSTIDKYYKDDFKVGTASLVAKIAANMAVIAQDPNNKQAVAAGKFMLSRLAPEVFSETHKHQFVDKNGNPINPGAGSVLDPYTMTDEQRELLRSTLSDVMKEAVEEVREHQQSKVPEAEYIQIEDQSDEAEYEEGEE